MNAHIWQSIGAEKERRDNLTVREECQRRQIVRETRYNRSRETRTNFSNEKGTRLSKADCVPAQQTD